MDGFVVKAGEQNKGCRDHNGEHQPVWRRPFRFSVLLRDGFRAQSRQKKNEQEKGRQHAHRQHWRYSPLKLEQILQHNGGGAAKAHASRHSGVRQGCPAHPEVRRAAERADTQRRGHGNDHIHEGGAVQGKQACPADQKRGEDTIRGGVLAALSRAEAEEQAVQQIAENNKHLQGIINLLPLPGGKIAFSGVVCQAEDGELQKDKGPGSCPGSGHGVCCAGRR